MLPPMANDLVVALGDAQEVEEVLDVVGREFNVKVAEDAETLWQICRDQAPDVVLIGAQFGGGGLPICHKLKTRPSTRHISVVMVCSRRDAVAPTDGADGLPDEILMRPIHGAELRVRLESTCRLRRYAAASVEGTRLDPLTSLFTRSHLIERLGHELGRAKRYGRSLTLLLVDLDTFSELNHRVGTARGDQLLREVARALTSRVRGVDLVARAGDDEFAVLLPETSLLVARPVAERLLGAIRAIHVTNADAERLDASVGVAGVPHGEIEDVPAFLRCAREALKHARTDGGGRVALY